MTENQQFLMDIGVSVQLRQMFGAASRQMQQASSIEVLVFIDVTPCEEVPLKFCGP